MANSSIVEKDRRRYTMTVPLGNDGLQLRADPDLRATFLSFRKADADERYPLPPWPAEYLLFSCELTKINRKGKKQRRAFVLSNIAVYNFELKRYRKPKRRIRLEQLTKMALSADAEEEFSLRTVDEYDYHYQTTQRGMIAAVLNTAHEGLLEKELPVVTLKAESFLANIRTKNSTEQSRDWFGTLKGAFSSSQGINEGDPGINENGGSVDLRDNSECSEEGNDEEARGSASKRLSSRGLTFKSMFDETRGKMKHRSTGTTGDSCDSPTATSRRIKSLSRNSARSISVSSGPNFDELRGAAERRRQRSRTSTFDSSTLKQRTKSSGSLVGVSSPARPKSEQPTSSQNPTSMIDELKNALQHRSTNNTTRTPVETASLAATLPKQPTEEVRTVDVDLLGIAALKKLITDAGLSHADCLEKSELRARAREAQKKVAGLGNAEKSVVAFSFPLEQKSHDSIRLVPECGMAERHQREDSHVLLRRESEGDSDHLQEDDQLSPLPDADLNAVFEEFRNQSKNGVLPTECLITSFEVVKINRKGKRQHRALVLSDVAVYNFDIKRYRKVKRRIKLDHLSEVVLSLESPDEFVLRAADEYDYRFETPQRENVVTAICNAYEGLVGRKLSSRSLDSDAIASMLKTKGSHRERAELVLSGLKERAKDTIEGISRGRSGSEALRMMHAIERTVQSSVSRTSSSTGFSQTSSHSGRGSDGTIDSTVAELPPALLEPGTRRDVAAVDNFLSLFDDGHHTDVSVKVTIKDGLRTVVIEHKYDTSVRSESQQEDEYQSDDDSEEDFEESMPDTVGSGML